MRTAIGVLEVDSVSMVETITADDARRAGYESAEAIWADLDPGKPGATYRVRLHLAGPDLRIELRNQLPTDDEVAVITERLRRLDRASTHGAWTTSVLQAIADRPAVRAPDLAASFGRETQPFKVDVRKLKDLGLTESLPVGYRVSPRGEVVLAALRALD